MLVTEAEQIAHALGEPDVAFLAAGERILHARGGAPPFTALTTLVQGIHESEPALARRIVRERIWTTREPGAFAAGMVKVAGRRCSVVSPRDHGLSLERSLHEVRYEPRPVASDVKPGGDWIELARSLVPPASGPRRERDRAVGAVLVSPAGDLLAASPNTNARNRTLHAELNVLTAAWLRAGRTPLPPGTRLYTTLEPCKMCAGLAWEIAAEPGTLAVYYADEEPGPAARDTVLERGSNARRRFARSRAQLEAECLFRVV